ncbi:MAG: hypothetical protein Q4D90_00420 [bacterium]|nr:hypothetical protein [bacterium]
MAPLEKPKEGLHRAKSLLDLTKSKKTGKSSCILQKNHLFLGGRSSGMEAALPVLF